MALLVRLKQEIAKKRPQIKKKKNSPDLAPSDYYLFADLKRMLKEKKFDSNEEVIAKSEAYFKADDKSFYKKGIQLLEKHWNECITLEGDYVDEWSQILPKSCCFISHPPNLLSHVLKNRSECVSCHEILKINLKKVRNACFMNSIISNIIFKRLNSNFCKPWI